MSLCESSFYCVWRNFYIIQQLFVSPLSSSWKNAHYRKMMRTVKCNNYSTCFYVVRREMFLGWRPGRFVGWEEKGRWNMATEKLFFFCYFWVHILWHHNNCLFRKVETMKHIFIRFVCFCFGSSRQNLITERYFCIISLHCNCSAGARVKEQKSIKIPDKSNYEPNEKAHFSSTFACVPRWKKYRKCDFFLLSDLGRKRKS